ncbi:MAG: molybdate ABC transporter substrate-binding protein [Neptuniibacter sp.]
MKRFYTLVVLYLFCSPLFAEKINVAVASNFTAAAKEIAYAFEKKHQSKVVLSFGSTGKLYAQILYGAPYHIFLAADEARPKKLIEDGNGVSGTRFTYAEGRVALYSLKLRFTDFESSQLPQLLLRQNVAIANPRTAPYGSATLNVLENLGVPEQNATKFVYGENIAQTFQFAETGNVNFAFVSLSQLIGKDTRNYWLIPRELHQPIKQDAVLLRSGHDNSIAHEFMSFLKAPETITIIRNHGYYL